MEHEMNHMNTVGISWLFAVIILFICALLICHIIFTLWKQRNRLYKLDEQYNIIVHSLPMSLGMISTMTVCVVVGAIMSHHLSTAYVLGLLIGVFISGIISFSFQDWIPILNGIVAGAMGGLMGVMIGIMIPQTGLYIVVILLMILFTTTWVTMNQRIRSQPVE
ncbi:MULTISPECIES: hypothetical protein [Bacillus]|uniref:hypothetical protein n=1 Tax=Bacillus TaxID=1386 RepID=UPI00046A6F43|nr:MULTISPECIES: hypothetical protein [Bacillus]MED1412664.1 hypothetical protein [Bacillus paramycoides]MED1462249.1 hypothetical protein [Bacillus paramycoides]MED1494308.1 hypothetical protein [Bacillus paramycoides]